MKVSFPAIPQPPTGVGLEILTMKKTPTVKARRDERKASPKNITQQVLGEARPFNFLCIPIP